MPRRLRLLLAATVAPSAILVRKERTLKRPIGDGARRRFSRLGAGADVVGNAIGGLHPEIVERRVEHRDLVQMLDPVGAVAAGHDQADWKSVQPRQVFAVHRVSDHHFAVERVVEVKRLDECRRLRKNRPVQSPEGDLNGAGLHAGLGQERFQRHAFPSRIAHRAIGELASGDARFEEAATVARTLIDRGELDRLEAVLQLRERQRQRACRPCPEWSGETHPESIFSGMSAR